MKKILMIFGALMLFVGAQAQNANRSGVVVELGGGYTTGNVWENYNYSYTSYYDYFLESYRYIHSESTDAGGQGGYISLDAGYQWATSRHFAVKAMATVGVPLAEVGYVNYGVKGMVRYTSNDFGSGQSIYAEVGVGPKLYNESAVLVLITPEAGVGLNINSHLFIGLDFVYNIITDYGLSYGVPQLKVGYRF